VGQTAFPVSERALSDAAALATRLVMLLVVRKMHFMLAICRCVVEQNAVQARFVQGASEDICEDVTG